MTPRQLTLSLTDQPSIVTVDRTTGHTFYLIRVTEKDAKTPVKRAHLALGMYEGRHLHKPQAIRCHATNAAAIGSEVMGIPVMVEPHSQPDDFWMVKEI